MSDPRLGVLIDADNVSGKVAPDLFEELAGYGTLTVKRAYGDWTGTQLNSWKDRLHVHAISPMQQFANTSGKNSTDSALIIDAMDLLYAGHLDGFVLVSSDSDFTRLATRLRESGMKVYGVGARKTPSAFREACDQFVFLENLQAPAAPEQPVAAAAPEPDAPARTSRGPAAESAEPSAAESRSTQAQLQSIVTRALNKTETDDDHWATLSDLGHLLVRTDPSFDPRSFRFAKLGDLVRAQPFLETRSMTSTNGQTSLHVRLKGRRG